MIKLSDAQIAQVIREASDGGSLVTLLASGSSQRLQDAAVSISNDWAYSRGLARALLVLAAFPNDGSDCELTQIARQVGLSASTAYRYIRTWTAPGFLEQMPRSRRYRRSPVPPKNESTT